MLHLLVSRYFLVAKFVRTQSFVSLHCMAPTRLAIMSHAAFGGLTRDALAGCVQILLLCYETCITVLHASSVPLTRHAGL